jgi:hypothetical protein
LDYGENFVERCSGFWVGVLRLNNPRQPAVATPHKGNWTTSPLQNFKLNFEFSAILKLPLDKGLARSDWGYKGEATPF